MEVASFHRCIPVVESSQASAVRFAARDLAASAGFDEEDSYRVGLVATELATNLVKHTNGVGGEVLVRPLGDARHGGVELISIDRGPGIADVPGALADGYSTAGSPGTGLGAVRRLADAFDIHSAVGRGTIAFARVGGRRHLPQDPPCPLDLAGVSVPKTGEQVCGDGWRVRCSPDRSLVALADGLGHGPFAAEAARAALNALSLPTPRTVVEMLQAMHGAARHTRGAASSLAEITPTAGVVRFGGVGNVGGTVLDSGETQRHTVAHPGTLGHQASVFREYTYPWDSDSTLVMYSDGLTSHWSLKDLPGVRQRHPAVIAAALYRDFSRHRDDVTVVVGRERR